MFDLRENPFVILGVTPRSAKADVNDAFEDALLDAIDVDDEVRLNLARQALFSPNDRLVAEVGYLLELRPSQARQALRAGTLDQWVAVAESTLGVAKSNALVEAMKLCDTADSCRTLAIDLLECWCDIDKERVYHEIAESRSLSGFGTVAEADIANCLNQLCRYHAESVLVGLGRTAELHVSLKHIVETEIVPNERFSQKFVSALVTAYAQQIGGRLAQGAERSLEYLRNFINSGSEQAFKDFESELLGWGRHALPLQLISRAKGVDEPHSYELYSKVRAQALDLANDKERFAESRRITQVLVDVFANLPGALDQLHQDSEVLDEILDQRELAKFLDPLIAAAGRAREDLKCTSRYLKKHGFVSTAPNPVGELRRSFERLLTAEIAPETRDHGARMLRALAVELFNEHEEIGNAKLLTSFLISNSQWFSREVNAQIANDNRELLKNEKMRQLGRAMKQADWKKARDLCSELRALASGTDGQELKKIAGLIDNKISRQKFSRFVWGGGAAVAIGFMAIAANESPGDPSGYEEYVAPTVEEPQVSVDYDPVIVSPSTDYQEDPQEEVAPSYGGGVLTLPELRYCTRQSERLKAARSLVAGHKQQSRFNSAVDDYNSRCGNFQYRDEDMARVRMEIPQVHDQLKEDAAQIVGSGSVDENYVPTVYPDSGSDDSETYEETDPSYQYGETDGY